MSESRGWVAGALALVLLLGCGGDDSPGPSDDADAGPRLDAGPEPPCAFDEDCDDGRYCNGAERCAAGMPGADERGCARSVPIDCDDGIACSTDDCDEDRRTCVHLAEDADGDGHRTATCTGMSGDALGDDCDDDDPLRYPGAAEICDAAGHDEDCDGATFGVRDADMDGSPDAACCNGSTCGDDCDDTRGGVHPRLPEACDLLDNDCDAMVDEGVERTFWTDADGDGFGDTATPTTMMECFPPAGFVENDRDCNDAAAGTNPAAPEVCDGADNDCDAMMDEGVLRSFWRDADGDRFGARGSTPMLACSPPAGFVEDSLDCDDARFEVHPGSPDFCDGRDNDCDGTADTEPFGSRSCGVPPSGAGTTACVGGTCVVTCPAGRGDCDGNFLNGCESDLRTDPAHCGTCTTACGIGGICTASRCNALREVTAGDGHTCVRRDGGTLICWGWNTFGQLGIGSVGNRYRPVLLTTIGDVTHVAAGATSTCAVQSTPYGPDSYCWGHNADGQLGNGSTTDTAFPTYVADTTLTTSITYGPGSMHTCRVVQPTTLDGLQCWGANNVGQVGNGTTGADVLTPVRPTLPAGFNPVQVVGGYSHTCALAADSRIACWGSDTLGQIGAGAGDNSTSTPLLIGGGGSQLAAGAFHNCIVNSGGDLYCMGDGRSGQLGDGTSSVQQSWVYIMSGVAEVQAGYRVTCARMRDGTARCWGDGYGGAIGDGSGLSRNRPTAVTGLTGVTDIAVGFAHACAIVRDAELWCWGLNTNGQLGDGTTMDRRAPVRTVDL